MTMHFRSLADQVAIHGAITAEELLSLRRELWGDSRVDGDEANAIFELNDELKHVSPEWSDFFVEAIIDYLINTASPHGYIDDAQAEWLISHFDRNGRFDSMTELELLEHLFERAESIPQRLQAYAREHIEQAVLTGEGPTRDGLGLSPGCINTEECRLLRRFIFAPGSERPAAVSKAEAEMLFRIKDATLHADNAPEWRQLFVQGVGSYLQGFGGHQPLTAERAAEFEKFMNNTATGIGSFFGRIAHANPMQGAKAIFSAQDDYLDFDDEAAADAKVTASEQSWLQAQMDADGELDELDQALLDFLAEE